MEQHSLEMLWLDGKLVAFTRTVELRLKYPPEKVTELLAKRKKLLASIARRAEQQANNQGAIFGTKKNLFGVVAMDTAAAPDYAAMLAPLSPSERRALLQGDWTGSEDFAHDAVIAATQPMTLEVIERTLSSLQQELSTAQQNGTITIRVHNRALTQDQRRTEVMQLQRHIQNYGFQTRRYLVIDRSRVERQRRGVSDKQFLVDEDTATVLASRTGDRGRWLPEAGRRVVDIPGPSGLEDHITITAPGVDDDPTFAPPRREDSLADGARDRNSWYDRFL